MVISHSQLAEASAYLDNALQELDMITRDMELADRQGAFAECVRRSLGMHAMNLLNASGRRVEVEAILCESISDEGIEHLEEKAFTGILGGSVVTRTKETDMLLGVTDVRYGFVLHVRPEVEFHGVGPLMPSQAVMANFENIEQLVLKAA